MPSTYMQDVIYLPLDACAYSRKHLKPCGDNFVVALSAAIIVSVFKQDNYLTNNQYYLRVGMVVLFHFHGHNLARMCSILPSLHSL